MKRLRAGAATDVGLARANNQDQLLVAAPIFAVADGMGGHAAGEVASLTAVDALRDAFGLPPPPAAPSSPQGPPPPQAPFSPQDVVEAVRAANRAVWNRAQAHAELRGMGTTLTAIALVTDAAAGGTDVMAVVNVGDSRTYRLRDGTLEQLTVDHSYVAELVAGGQINAAQAEVHPQRHVLTRALGVSPDVEVDLLVMDPVAGHRYLLCSDGLSRELTDSRIEAVLRRLADPADAARELVGEAKQHGGNDNITVVVVDVTDAEGETEGSDTDGPTAALPLAEVFGEAGLSEAGLDEKGFSEKVTSRREQRRAARARVPRTRVPRTRLLTVRVVAFLALLLGIVFVAAAGTEYYARSTYFVGLRASHLTIFKGRPGGVLWWKPTIAAETDITTDEVDAYLLPSLRAGVQESSLGQAHTYINRLAAARAPSPATLTPTSGTKAATVAP